MKLKNLYTILILVLLSLTTSSAQLNVTSGASSADIQVCIDTQTVDITLSATNNITGNSIAINLPPGVNYVPGSVTVISNSGAPITITEASIANLQQPTFTFSSSMAIGDVSVFRIGRTADCQTISFRDLGNVLLDSVTVTYNGTLTADNLGNINTTVIPFGLNEALVSLSGTGSGGTVANLQGYPGDVLTRDIFITNGGLGCVQVIEFYLVDAAAGIQINQLAVTATTSNPGTSPPSLPITITPHTINGDTSFYTLDIEALNGTGARLCNGQTITIQETVEILTCFSNVTDGETRYGTFWNCNASCQPINTTTANVAIPPGTPNLSFSVSGNNNPNCFEGLTLTKTFRVSNTGSAEALNANFAFEVRNTNSSATIFIANTSTITTSGGVGPNPIVPTSFTNKKVAYSVASIPAGGFVDITIDVQHICPATTSCGLFRYDGYRREDISYQDECGNNYSSSNANIDGNRDLQAVTPTENNLPSILDGQAGAFTTTFASLNGVNTNSTLTWEFILPPCGVSFANNPSDIDWGGVSPNTVTISGDTIRAVFIPTSSGVFNGDPFTVNLTGACGTCGTSQSIQKRLTINTCPSNANHCAPCLYEVTSALTIEDCNAGGGSCNGADIASFSFLRTNLGLPDNDNNRFADATGTIDSSQINRSAFIIGDTAEALIAANIQVNTGTPVLAFAYAETTMDDHWTFLDATIEVFDASAGTSFTCTSTNATSSVAAGRRTFIVDVSPNTLGAGCASMLGFIFADGDSVTIHMNFENTLNGNSHFSGSVNPVDFYLAEVANPTGAQKLSCGANGFSATYTVFDIRFGIDIAGTGTFGSCGTRRIDLEFEPRTGSNQQNVNLFPFEWRPIGYPDTIRMVMPTGYVYVSARMNGFDGIPNNSAIAPVNANSDTLVFITGDAYRPGGIPSNPTQGNVLDGINRSELQVFIRATCETPDGVNEPITMILDGIHPLPQLAALDLFNGSRTENIRWDKPDIALTPVSTQTAEGITNMLEWTIRVSNTTNNSDAANVFLSQSIPSGNVNITTMELIAINGAATGPTALTQQNNTWQLGGVDRNDFYDVRITATYSQCTPDTFFILAGFDCVGYPNSFSAYSQNCPVDTITLFTDPKTATLQLNPIATGVTDDICDTLTYAFTLNSADLANVMNPFLNITLPPGILMLGDPTIEYPLGTTPRSFTATPIGQSLSIDLGVADAQNPGTHSIATNGILGIREASNANERQVTITFQFRTDCSFQSGSSFYLQPVGQTPCGSRASGSDITAFEPPIVISGLTPPYNVSTKVTIVGSSTCNDTVQNIQIEMIPDAASTGRDTGYFDLPINVVYAGNYTCSESNPAICPDFVGVVNNANGTSSVSVRYPDTWSLGDTVNFSFDVNTAGFAGCSGSELITVNHTVTMAGPTCDANGLPCGDVKIITGQANLTFSVLKPDFEIDNLTALTNAVTSGQSYTLTFDITNNGLDAPAGMIAEFYCADAAGAPIGAPVHTHTIAVPISANQTITQNVFFTTPTSCNNLNGMVILISQTPASASTQCICQDEQSLITDIPSDPDLPVDWLYFEADKTGNNAAVLTWGTATELNSLGFEIEQAKPTNGIPQFEMIGFVESQGHNNMGAYYSFDVNNMVPGVHYFRLRQVDVDGSTEYSETRAVVITGDEQNIKIYPTLIQPSNHTLYLFSPREDNIVVEIFSILGQESAVLHIGSIQENSLTEIPFNQHDLPAGHYVIRVRGAQETFTQKVSVLR